MKKHLFVAVVSAAIFYNAFTSVGLAAETMTDQLLFNDKPTEFSFWTDMRDDFLGIERHDPPPPPPPPRHRPPHYRPAPPPPHPGSHRVVRPAPPRPNPGPSRVVKPMPPRPNPAPRPKYDSRHRPAPRH